MVRLFQIIQRTHTFKNQPICEANLFRNKWCLSFKVTNNIIFSNFIKNVLLTARQKLEKLSWKGIFVSDKLEVIYVSIQTGNVPKDLCLYPMISIILHLSLFDILNNSWQYQNWWSIQYNFLIKHWKLSKQFDKQKV